VAKSDRPLGQERETILLVEDEKTLLFAVRRLLEMSGYAVLAASSVGEAIEIATDPDQPIDLLLSDYLLPSATGRQLAAVLKRSRPNLRVLFMSGFSERDLPPDPEGDAEAVYLQKPFASEQLLLQVRLTLHPRRRRNDAVG
jgi:CheY-like chemotaxis protein